MNDYRVTLSRSAARDIDAIADYTIERWGEEQARKYVATLRQDIESLREFARRYPEHLSRGRTFRKMASGHHIVFYLVSEETVDVVRVLHERMDFDDQIV